MPGNGQGNSFNTIFGSDSNTGVFNSNPQSPVASSVDQALTGGGTITSANLYGQPQPQRQDVSNLRNIQEWMAADRAQGVTNPIISMMRYQAFMEPMEKQKREDNLRAAFATLRNPEATDADKLNAYALMEYELKRPGLKEEIDWNREKREHERAMFPLQEESARLGLDNTRSIINNRNATQRNATQVSDILRGFSGEVFPIEKPGNYEDSDLSKTRPELVSAADILNTYARNKFGKGLKVNGGWRSAAHNAEVNGTKTSHHLSGHAMDIDASSLSEAELADLQAFAKQIGLNADGDNMYHDKGTGYHMHITLPEGYHLKSVDLGNGKFLTPSMMRGEGSKNKGKKNQAESLISVQEGIGIHSKLSDWSKAGFSNETMKPLIDYMLPIYERYLKSTGSEEEAIKAVNGHIQGSLGDILKNSQDKNIDYGQMGKLIANIQQIYRDEHDPNLKPDPDDPGNIPMAEQKTLDRSKRKPNETDNSKTKQDEKKSSYQIVDARNPQSFKNLFSISDNPNRDKSLTWQW